MTNKLNLKENNIEKIAKDEIFTQIPNFSRYYVSNYGRVWSTIRKIMHKQFPQGIKGNQYLSVRIVNDNGEEKKLKAHRLVAQNYVGNPKPGQYNEVHHINGINHDNNYKNLQWVDRPLHKQLDAKRELYYCNFISGKPKQTKNIQELSEITDLKPYEIEKLIGNNADFNRLIKINDILYAPVGVGYNQETNEFYNINQDSFLVGIKRIKD